MEIGTEIGDINLGKIVAEATISRLSEPVDITDMKRSYRTAIEGDFAEDMEILFSKEQNLRYGENPNQPAALYAMKQRSKEEVATWFNNEPFDKTSIPPHLAAKVKIELAKTGKGGLSATNMMDVTRALDVLKFFEEPSVAVMKHTIPSGFATQFDETSTLDWLYEQARDADARSAFGSVVVFNVPVDKATAKAIMSTFVEGVAAPAYDNGVMDIFEKRKDLRVIIHSGMEAMPKYVGDDVAGLYDVKALPTGRAVVQTPYLSSIRSVEDTVLRPLIRYKVKGEEGEKSVHIERAPTVKEIIDLFTAWYVNIGTRSNGIVLVKNGVTLAVGSGQQERVGAIEQAITKTYQKALDRKRRWLNPNDKEWTPGGMSWEEMLDDIGMNPLKGAVMSSDAFFPYRDSVDTAAKVGMTAIIQPYGSINDYTVIQAANEHNIAVVATRERCFAHF